MKILISGSSGLIGQDLVKTLSKKGHLVLSLNRKNRQITPYWNIEKKIIELGLNSEIDVVINLAGENISQGRWTKQKKNQILRSRVDGTQLISKCFSKAKNKPRLIIAASAIGFYGNRGADLLSENSAKGIGFLSDVCSQWESSTNIAKQSGIRVVNIRLGMVLSKKGGALKKMILPYKLGLGGIVGNGKQYISWITLNEVSEIINFIIENESLSGPINLVSPGFVTNHQFTKILGMTLKRFTFFQLPSKLAKIIFGEMANELLLTSTKVQPEKLLASGYKFKETHLDNALKNIFE